MNYISNKEIYGHIINNKKNALVLAPAGYGKSYMINELKRLYENLGMKDNIIACAPTGIASQNIGGRTVQALFKIKIGQYEFDERSFSRYGTSETLANAKVLIVDEVSMLRLELIDIVDQSLRIAKKNDSPFGNIKIMLIGDLFQLPPVVTDRDNMFLSKFYRDLASNQYYFYNSNVMQRDDYFNSNFDIYQLNTNHRQKDPVFQGILNEMRYGDISAKSLETINRRVGLPEHTDCKFDQDIQYLTLTKKESEKLNGQFISRLPGKTFISEPAYRGDFFFDENLHCCTYDCFTWTLRMKIGMKIMFVCNDYGCSRARYSNGTIGWIRDIQTNDGTTPSCVEIETDGRQYLTIAPQDVSIYSKDYRIKHEIGRVANFPFIAAYSICIDKAQGLTLDKMALVLENSRLRDNQLYVALSRVRSLENLFISRPVIAEDIHAAREAKSFYNCIEDRIVHVVDDIPDKNINIIINNANNSIVNVTL